MKDCLGREADVIKCSECGHVKKIIKHRWRFMYEVKTKYIPMNTGIPTTSKITTKTYNCVDCGTTTSTNEVYENALDVEKIGR